MPLPLAINGVGRIGRALIRQIALRDDLLLAAVNDLAPVDRLARLLTRDTFLGPFPGEVEAVDGRLVVDGHVVPVYGESDPAAVPWDAHGTRLVVEATGTLTRGRSAAVHFGGSVEHVVVSGNAPEADITVCYGVNHHLVDPAEHRLISNSSCTTNCLAAVAKVLNDSIGIERALLNTVHCFNNSQSLTDAPHTDARRARAATVNMIPTTTGAATAIGLVIPELANRLTGFAVRVPAAQVSLIDLVAELAREATDSEVNELFRRAADGTLEGVLSISAEACVSTDFIGDTHSAIVDLPLTQVVGEGGGRLVRVVAWYDNEMGYASRLADLAAWLGAR